VRFLFTGIIEEVGVVEKIILNEKISKISIVASEVLKETKIGDSIATNGVCLTVTAINKNGYEADVMGETIKRSNLGKLKMGSKVNLERALTLNSRLGGHMVSGHIDGVGQIINIEKKDIATWYTINVPAEILKYVVEKGSIAIDGISLTVAYVDSNCFKVSIIPHTGEETTLSSKKVFDDVNIECDVMGKYVEKLLFSSKEETPKSSISKEFLIDNGFM
jgi:riboflavin synthase